VRSTESWVAKRHLLLTHRPGSASRAASACSLRVLQWLQHPSELQKVGPAAQEAQETARPPASAPAADEPASPEAGRCGKGNARGAGPAGREDAEQGSPTAEASPAPSGGTTTPAQAAPEASPGPPRSNLTALGKRRGRNPLSAQPVATPAPALPQEQRQERLLRFKAKRLAPAPAPAAAPAAPAAAAAAPEGARVGGRGWERQGLEQKQQRTGLNAPPGHGLLASRGAGGRGPRSDAAVPECQRQGGGRRCGRCQAGS